MPFVRSEGEVKTIFTATIPLSTVATYSDPIEIMRGGYFGIWMSGGPASACSAAQLCMWYELSYDNIAANFVSAGNVFANWNGLSAVASGAAIYPYPMPWMRVGLSATSSSVTSGSIVIAKLFEQS